MTKQLLFDLESTGLLRRGSTVHCIVMRDMQSADNPIVFDYKPERAVIQGVKQLENADVLIGHNIVGYDIPLLKEQYEFNPRGQVLDTLVLSRLFYPHIIDRDYERRPTGMPQRLYGRHSLEAWGYRLRCFKGDFAKSDSNDWSQYTPEMLDYCIQDTAVTLKLFELLQRRMQDYA